MEGDRILRCVLNESPSYLLVKDVENYLKPAERNVKGNGSEMTKYQTFSLKLLRCSIQAFDKAKGDICHLLEACKVAVNYVASAYHHWTSANNIQACELERLTKLLYHFLAHLSKIEDLTRFSWFSTKMLYFLKLEAQKQSKSNPVSIDPEIVKMNEKIFEIHWKLAGKASKNMELFQEVFLIRMIGLRYLLDFKKDLKKFEKYFENMVLNFLHENRSQSIVINKEAIFVLKDIIASLSVNLPSNSKDTASNQGTSMYIVLLSFKLLLIHGGSLECAETLSKGLIGIDPPSNSKPLISTLINTHRSHSVLKATSSCKITKTLCKQAGSVKLCLQGLEATHQELFRGKIFMVKPKIAVIYDIIKEFLKFQEKLCWEIIGGLCNMVISLKNHVEVAFKSICCGLKNGSNSKVVDDLLTVFKALCTQWYSFVSWCLQLFQTWLSKTGKMQVDGKCTCITKSSFKKDDLFKTCCTLVTSGTSALKIMEDWKVNVLETDYNWIGVTSYNLGVVAQKDGSLKTSITLFDQSIQNLKEWVQKSPNEDAALTRLQQTNLVFKHHILIDALVKSGSSDTALSKIADFLCFLLSGEVANNDCLTRGDLIREQIHLWIKTQEKASRGGSECEASSITSELTGLSKVDLKFVAECEMTELTTGRSRICIEAVRELLSFITKTFDGKDKEFVAWAMLEYAWLPYDAIETEERVQVCSEAISRLEECTDGENDPSSANDMLATGFFQLGCCQRKLSIANVVNGAMDTYVGLDSDTKPIIGDEEFFCNQPILGDMDYITSFNTALDIWSALAQSAVKGNDCSSFQRLFRRPEKTASCLYYIGHIYALNRQRFSAVHAFTLSSLLLETISPNVWKHQAEIKVAATCKITRLLTEIFDFPSALSVLNNVGEVDETENLVCLNFKITKAFLLQRAGENQKAINILKSALLDARVLQKTPKAFFTKADCLLTLALSSEHPQCALQSVDYHPLSLAQEALKILRNLMHLHLECKENSSKKDNQKSQEVSDVSPWIVACKLLDCLLYIAQRYQLQGCVPEARCHIKEALILCEQFSLIERKLEFLVEDAKASLLSHDEEKAEMSISEIVKTLRAKTEEGKRPHEVPAFYRHEEHCACEFCSDVFLVDLCLKCLMLRRHYNLIASKEIVDTRYKAVSLSAALEGAVQRGKNAVINLRNCLRSYTAKKKKKVKFSSHSDKSLCSKDMFDDKTVCSLEPEDVSRLVYCGQRIEFACIDYRLSLYSQNCGLQNDINTTLSDIRTSLVYRVISLVCRTAIAKLLQIKVEMLLASDQGLKAVEHSWKLCRNIQKATRSGAGLDVPEAKKESPEAEQVRDGRRRRGRKPKAASRKSAKPTANIEAPVPDEKDDVKGKHDEDMQLDQLLDDLSKMCSEGLSLLIPQLDCLQIKSFYELLSLVSGQKSPKQTAYLEQLSFSRTLHQQLLSRSIKNMRKSVSEYKASCNDSEALFLEATISTVTGMNEAFAFQNEENISKLLLDELPSDWRICSLRLSNVGAKAILITRLQAGKQPLVARLPINDQDETEKEDSEVGSLVRDLASVFVTDPFEEFEDILEQSLRSLQTDDVKTWWNDRKKLDARLKKMLSKIEDKWLGSWKGLLHGERIDPTENSLISELAKEFCDDVEAHYSVKLPRDFVEILFDSYQQLKKVQVMKGLEELLDSQFTEQIYEMFFEKAERLTNEDTKPDVKSTPCRGRKEKKRSKNNDATKRAPVILVLDKHLQKIPWESTSILRHQTVSRMPSLILTKLSHMISETLLTNGVDVSDTFYVLNPRNDLQNTQKTFEKWFQSDQGWQGISGRAPTENEYKRALQDHQMFIYCGHGNGREFLRGDDIQRLSCRALTFLMGCSSGKLQVKGELDARGMALHYLMAGCPAIVANLWDVTDKDIDRFLSKLLKDWLDTDVNLTDCISSAREACLLPHLIGASPVLYGLPVITKAKSR